MELSLCFRTVEQFQNFCHAATSSSFFNSMPPHFCANEQLSLTSDTQQGHRGGIWRNSFLRRRRALSEFAALLPVAQLSFIFASVANVSTVRRLTLCRPQMEDCPQGGCVWGVGRLPEGLRDDGKERLNYRLKSGTAGRLYWGVQGRRRKVGIWRTRSSHADERGERLFKLCSVVRFGARAGTA